VADFIGDTNFLDLPVTAVDGIEASVTLPGGTETRARLPEGLRPRIGETVTLVIRPEQARLVEDGASDLEAQVESSTFFGTDTHVHLRLLDGQGFILRRQNVADMPEPEPGTRVGLRLSPGALRVLRN